MKKKITISLIILAVIVAGIAIYFTQKPKEPETIKIGAILPLTGPSSEIGTWQKTGIDLAIENINKAGGIEGKKLIVLYEDSKGDPRTGTMAFTKLIASRDIYCVFSSLSSVSSAILPIADKQKIVLVMLAVSLPGIADRSEWAFRFNVGSEDEAHAMAQFLATKKGTPKIAIYYINDEFGNGALQTFRKTYGGYRGDIVWERSYEKNQTDHRSNLVSLKNIKVDGVYVIGYVKSSVLAIKQMREMGIKVPIYANMALTVPVFLTLGGEAVEGVHFTTNLFNPDSKEQVVRQFVKMYVQRFVETPNFFSAFAYDAVNIVAEAIKRGGNINIGIKEGILSIKDYDGVTGKITVEPNGDAKFPVRIVKVEKGKIVEVEK